MSPSQTSPCRQVAELHPVLAHLVKKVEFPKLQDMSTATWSFVENPDSILSTLKVRFDRRPPWRVTPGSCLLDEQQKVLKECVGQGVNLGFGDVAMEVEYSENEEPNGHYLDSISLIIGGYANTTHVSVNLASSVFYLGRIVRGQVDFSFLRRFVTPGNFLPTVESMIFFSKFSECNDDDNVDDSEEE